MLLRENDINIIFVLNIIVHCEIVKDIYHTQMLSLYKSIDLGIIRNTIQSVFQLSDKRKERIDYILDPLQAIYTLALYSFYPVGSKICIRQNILSIQPSNYSQGAVRWLNADSKEDIFHLFYACKRFATIYSYIRKYRVDDTNLFDMIVKHAKRGLNKLSDTYSNVDKLSLQHTIRLYQTLLENPNIVDPHMIDPQSHSHSHSQNRIIRGGSVGGGDDDSASVISNMGSVISNGGNNGSGVSSDIETVFHKIHNVYSKEHLWIMTNILRLMETNEGLTNYKLIDGFHLIFEKKNEDIKKWIQQHMLF